MTLNRDTLLELCNKIPTTHQSLIEAIQRAARYAITNPLRSLEKSNIALNIIVRDVYEKEFKKSVAHVPLHTLLNSKAFSQRVQPRRVYLLMNLIYKMT